MKIFKYLPVVFFAMAAFFYFSSPQGPSDDAFIDDRASLLEDEQRQQVLVLQRTLLAEEGTHLHLVTFAEQEADLDSRVRQLIGEKLIGANTEGRGLLLAVDPDGQKIRLLATPLLEAIYTDGFIAYVNEKKLHPFPTGSQLGSGVIEAIQLVVAQSKGKVDAALFSRLSSARSGNSLASSSAEGDAVPNDVINPAAFKPGKAPIVSLQVYMDVLEKGIKTPGLPLYTPETRDLLRNMQITDEQQSRELKYLKRKIASSFIAIEGTYAVIRFPVRERLSPPYFLHQRGGRWELDLATMSQVIGRDAENQWHYKVKEHPYAFAIPADRFDENGFLR